MGDWLLPSFTFTNVCRKREVSRTGGTPTELRLDRGHRFAFSGFSLFFPPFPLPKRVCDIHLQNTV